MPPVFRRRRIGSIDFVSGSKQSLDIPRDGVITGYDLRLRYTVTNETPGPIGPLYQTLARLIRRVDIVMGGRDTVFSQSGESISARQQYEFRTVPVGMGDTVVLTDALVTAYDVHLKIPRILPTSNAFFATADDVRRVNQATMEVTFGAADTSDMFTTANAAISLVTLDVFADYLLDIPDQTFGVREMKEIRHTVTATSPAELMTIDGGTGLTIRSLAIAVLVANIGSNTPLDAGSIKIQTGAFVFHEIDAPVIQADNKALFSQEALITGFYLQPLTFGGDLRMAIATGALSADLNALFDITVGAGTHEILMSVESTRGLQVT